jgi:hypothetical protein
MAVAHARKPIKSNRLIKIVAGNCWDNALPESFFATVKTELIHPHSWSTRRRQAFLTQIEGEPLACGASYHISCSSGESMLLLVEIRERPQFTPPSSV